MTARGASGRTWGQKRVKLANVLLMPHYLPGFTPYQEVVVILQVIGMSASSGLTRLSIKTLVRLLARNGTLTFLPRNAIARARTHSLSA